MRPGRGMGGPGGSGHSHGHARGQRGGFRGRGAEGWEGPWAGRVRRGDMRVLLLAGLLDGPAHGYELMQRLEERTNGQWRPSPGSVYPMLQQLEDEGLAKSQERDGRRVYELTEAGHQQADPTVLDSFATKTANVTATVTVFTEIKQLSLAAKQVAITGDPAVAEKAAEIVKGARQALYRLLAEQ